MPGRRRPGSEMDGCAASSGVGGGDEGGVGGRSLGGVFAGVVLEGMEQRVGAASDRWTCTA